MRKILFTLLLSLLAPLATAAATALTVYQDPNCGCCADWADHMRSAGFAVTEIKTSAMSRVKQRLGVPHDKLSCHTAVIEETGQIVEGHVPANAVFKLLKHPNIHGIAAPGMPMNSPGMGQLDGTLVTLDFEGRPFSKD